MTYCAFKTADTNEMISTVQPFRPVYLLRPNGESSIETAQRETLGLHMVENAMLQLVYQNEDAIGIDACRFDRDECIGVGYSLLGGEVFRDTTTGDIWHIKSDNRHLVPGHFVDCSLHEVIPALGDSAVNLYKAGKLEVLPISQYLNLPHPLKFSFNPEAKYEDLPASAWELTDEYPYAIHTA